MGKRRQLVLINSVVWPETYPRTHPLLNSEGWFRRLVRSSALNFQAVPATDEAHRALEDDSVAGVILSGSTADAWSDAPTNRLLVDIVLEQSRRGVPLLGVCHGHQIIARALGAHVGPTITGPEVGLVDINLTSEGRADPLFGGLPSRFAVLQSHRDAVLEAPLGAAVLASSDSCHIQSFRAGTMWGVQFHPELPPESLALLWRLRLDDLSEAERSGLEPQLTSLMNAPARQTCLGRRVLRNFVNFCERGVAARGYQADLHQAG